jgi:S-adenosylmethionine decarboxylase
MAGGHDIVGGQNDHAQRLTTAWPRESLSRPARQTGSRLEHHVPETDPTSTAPALRHLLVELSGCDASALDDPGRVREALEEAARLAGTQVLDGVLHHFAPQGVTGMLLLAESHVAIHTWPEQGFCACDLLSCRAEGDLDRVAAALGRAFSASRASVRIVDRRLP